MGSLEVGSSTYSVELQAHFPFRGRKGKELTFVGQLLSANFRAGGMYIRSQGSSEVQYLSPQFYMCETWWPRASKLLGFTA